MSIQPHEITSPQPHVSKTVYYHLLLLLSPSLPLPLAPPPTSRSALEVAMAMSDVAYEAQACYSLGNTYTLMKDYLKAIDYHSRHLRHAIHLHDR